MDWIEGLKQIGVLVATCVAVYGIDSWRREHRGKRRIELAEDSLALFYEAADAIKHIRHPAGFSTETDIIERSEGETEEQFRARKNASVVFLRYNQYQELFNKLYAMRYRFMAQVGKPEAKPFDELHSIVNEIIGSARLLARLWGRDHFRTAEQWDQHRRQVEESEAIFWEGLAENDPINPRVAAVLEEMERTCQYVISGKGTLYAAINWRLWGAS